MEVLAGTFSELGAAGILQLRWEVGLGGALEPAPAHLDRNLGDQLGGRVINEDQELVGGENLVGRLVLVPREVDDVGRK